MKNISSQLFSKTRLMFLSIVTILTPVSNALLDSCQFITAMNTGAPTISSYQYEGLDLVPKFRSRLKTVQMPELVTVSEDNKFVIVTDSENGITKVYSVSLSCELSDAYDFDPGRASPNQSIAVLTNKHWIGGKGWSGYNIYFLRKSSRIDVYKFYPDSGEISQRRIATQNLTYAPIGMAYNSNNHNLYIANNRGYTILATSSDKLTIIDEIHSAAQILGKIQTFGNLLVASEGFIDSSGLKRYGISSYEVGGTENPKEFTHLSQFIFKDSKEMPYDFSVSHFMGSMSVQYILSVTTTGKKVYIFDMDSSGKLAPGSKDNIFDLGYDARFIASTWSTNFTKFHSKLDYHRVSLLQDYGNLQTTIASQYQNRNKFLMPELDLMYTFVTPNIIAPLNMVISPAPEY